MAGVAGEMGSTAVIAQRNGSPCWRRAARIWGRSGPGTGSNQSSKGSSLTRAASLLEFAELGFVEAVLLAGQDGEITAGIGHA